MAKQGLNIETRQRQRLAPLQLQLVPMLTMSAPEIEEEVRREIEDNPALEVADSDSQRDDERDSEKDDSYDSLHDSNDDEADVPRYKASNRSADDEVYSPTVVAEQTLADYLTDQLGERDLSDDQMLVAKYIIGNIDSNGWLLRTPAAIADDVTFKAGLEVERDDVLQVLEVVRQLDPPGIAAEDLRTCLLLQLDRKPATEFNSQLRQLIDRHLPDLAKRQYAKICDRMHLDRDQLKELMQALSKLNPKPGSAFVGGATDAKTQQITPDFEVTLEGERLTLSLLNRIPELHISETYENANKQLAGKKNLRGVQAMEATDVRDKYSRASDFIQVLRMRQEKLFLTMKSIVDRQRDYFLTGDEARLKPMVLKHISKDTGIDQSVISRVTQQKYVATPWGVKQLRFFFSEGLGEVSNREIMTRIREIVDAEDKTRPLSDENLRDLLKAQGYKVARRTVAKYRKELGIADSRIRKEL